MDQKLHNFLVFSDGEWLGEKICEIITAFAPADRKMTRTNAIPNPMKLHINTLGAFRFDRVGGNAVRAFVVT